MQELSAEIIRRCMEGDAGAFAALVQRYERPLFGFVYRLGCTPAGREPDDIVQEILLKVYENIGRFQAIPGSSFTTWLFTIARNHCISLTRRARVPAGRLSLDAAGDWLVDDRCQEPPEATAGRETAEQVAQAVALLAEPSRSALVLRYYENMTYAQIAQVLGCEEGTARSRVARAKQALAELLQDVYPLG